MKKENWLKKKEKMGNKNMFGWLLISNKSNKNNKKRKKKFQTNEPTPLVASLVDRSEKQRKK